MITFVRTASIASGKAGEAVTFAHEVAKLSEKITGAKVGVSMPMAGNPWRIAWTAAYPDAGAMEVAGTKLLSDPEYTKLLQSAAPYFQPGTTYDEWWKSI